MSSLRYSLILASVVVCSAIAQADTASNPYYPPSPIPFDKATLSETSLSSPALANFRDKLFIAWRGLDNRLNVMSSSDGRNFAGKVTLQETSSSAPALVYFKGRLYIAWRELDNRLSVAWSPDGTTFVLLPSAGIPGKITLADTSLDSPVLAADPFEGKIYLCWTGMDTRLYCRSSEDFTNLPLAQRISLNELSNVAPKAIVSFRTLSIAWTGLDRRLNIMSSVDGVNFGNKRTFSDTSSVTPALNFIHNNTSPTGHIHMVWTGSDTRIRVVGPSLNGFELALSEAMQEFSFVGPALAARSLSPAEGSYIAWTGTDNHLNVAKIHAVDSK